MLKLAPASPRELSVHTLTPALGISHGEFKISLNTNISIAAISQCYTSKLLPLGEVAFKHLSEHRKIAI